MDKTGKVKPMDRYLSSLDVWAMSFGCMVGWGAFVMPGTTFLPVAGPLGTVLSMIAGLAVMMIIAFSVSYLMTKLPRTGGIYSYTKQAFGRDHAFLCSWFLCLSYLTVVFLNGTALFLVIRTLFGRGFQEGSYYTVAGNAVYFREVAISAAVLAVIGALFIVARPMLQRLQTVLAVILFAGVVIIAVVSLPHAIEQVNVSAFGFQGVNKGFAVFSLMILAPWAFVGFEVTSLDTAHFRFPLAKTKRILFSVMIMAAFVYISMTLASVSAVPDKYGSWVEYIYDLGNLDGVMSVPTFYAAQQYLGSFGLIVIAVTAVAAILTGIIGAYRATMRVLSTMAEDKILSELFSRTSYSILFIMVLSIIISLLGRNTLIWFVDLTSFGAIVAYGYTSAAACKIAKTENDRPAMIIGAIGKYISAVFVIVQLIPRLTAFDAMGSEAFLLLSLWCLLGFVFYWRTIRKSTIAEYSGMPVSGTVLFSLLIYASLMWAGKNISMAEDTDRIHTFIVTGGVVLMLIIFSGLAVMQYIQDLLRKKHEEAEREKIRAVEGSLAKSRFLFNMSHDIRTPMNAIIGYTELALKEPATGTQKDYLEKIEKSGRQLLDLINDILEMSRIENGKVVLEYAPYDLCELIEGMKDLFDEQMRQKNMDFSVHYSSVQNRYVWCDGKNLNRVLLNLIANAYKFTPEGGSISASLYETSGGADGYSTYEFRIRDSGIGMSKEFVERMFDAFERERTSTDSGIEGTGLGLAITKNLVDLMGGTIDVITSPGSGTEMIIRIKFRHAGKEDLKTEKEKTQRTESDPVDFTGKRLLLVEDNEVNLEIAKMILEQFGINVDTAENGQIAVDKVTDPDNVRYDVILMDIQMPVMDGYTAARAIRALDDPELANIPIIALTANAFREDIQAAKDAGMQSHIAKPIDINMLKYELTEILNKKGGKE